MKQEEGVEEKKRGSIGSSNLGEAEGEGGG